MNPAGMTEGVSIDVDGIVRLMDSPITAPKVPRSKMSPFALLALSAGLGGGLERRPGAIAKAAHQRARKAAR